MNHSVLDLANSQGVFAFQPDSKRPGSPELCCLALTALSLTDVGLEHVCGCMLGFEASGPQYLCALCTAPCPRSAVSLLLVMSNVSGMQGLQMTIRNVSKDSG